MVQTVGITKAITNLNEAHDKFNLSQTADTQFFTEWCEDLPEITDSEKKFLNRLKNRYLYYADGEITEGTIDRIMVQLAAHLQAGLSFPAMGMKLSETSKVAVS